MNEVNEAKKKQTEKNGNKVKEKYQSTSMAGTLLKIFWDGLKEGNVFSKFFLYVQNQELDTDAKVKEISGIEWTGECACENFSVTLEGKKIKKETANPVTPDQVRLDTFEICPNAESKKDQAERKYTIHFRGQAEFYENLLDTMEKEAKDFGQTVIGFNYRGIGESSGSPTSMDDLVQDGIAQVKRLLDSGVKPDNIRLYGWSMGGGVATLVAKHFHDQQIDLKLFNDRSFSSLVDVVMGYIRTIGSGGEFGQNSGRSEHGFGIALAFILKPLVKAILGAAGWDNNIAAAYSKLPKENKCAVNATDDPIISFKTASLYSGLKDPAAHKVNTAQSRNSEKNSHTQGVEDLNFLKPDIYLIPEANSKKQLDEKYKNQYDKLPAIIKRGPEIFIYWFDAAKKQTCLELSKNPAAYKNLSASKNLNDQISIKLSEEIRRDLSSTMNLSANEIYYKQFMDPDSVAKALAADAAPAKKVEERAAQKKLPEITPQQAQKKELSQLLKNIAGLTQSLREAIGDSSTFSNDAKMSMETKLREFQVSLQNKATDLWNEVSQEERRIRSKQRSGQPSNIQEEIKKLGKAVEEAGEFIEQSVKFLNQGIKADKITNLDKKISDATNYTNEYVSKAERWSPEQGILTSALDFMQAVRDAIPTGIAKEMPSFGNYPVEKPIESGEVKTIDEATKRVDPLAQVSTPTVEKATEKETEPPPSPSRSYSR